MTASIAGSAGGGCDGSGSNGGYADDCGSDSGGSGSGSNGGGADRNGSESSTTNSGGSASTGSDGGWSRAVEAVLAMLGAASGGTRREVHTLLAAALHAPPTAAQLRVAELGFLSSLLTGHVAEGFDFRQCERTYYDEVRAKTAPSSRSLVDAYGSWTRACRAAYGLQADGTTVGPGKPWPTRSRAEVGRQDYTRDEVLDAVRKCADELRRAGVTHVPSSWQYDEWVRRHKLAAKKQGRKLRLPYVHNIYRRLPSRRRGSTRWRMVLELAGLNSAGSPEPH